MAHNFSGTMFAFCQAPLEQAILPGYASRYFRSQRVSRAPISPLRRQHSRSVKMTRIVLLVSFFILLGRLVFVILGAISEHQQKQHAVSPPAAMDLLTPASGSSLPPLSSDT